MLFILCMLERPIRFIYLFQSFTWNFQTCRILLEREAEEMKLDGKALLFVYGFITGR